MGEGGRGVAPITAEAPITPGALAFGDLHHDLNRVASHERGIQLEVIVATSMSITNPAQLVSE